MPAMSRSILSAFLLSSVAPAATIMAQQSAPPPGAETLYVRTNVMITMRDGVRLNTEIFAPRNARETLPILLLRTPYGVGPNRIRAVNSPYKELHEDGYIFEYAARMETSKEQDVFQFDTYDTYEWYLKLGSLANVNAKYLKGKIPTWNDYVAHPNYDRFWQRQTILNYLTKPVTVPTLNVAGWWDQEDFYGPITIYRALEKQDRNNLNYFVAGPWNHGGWNRPEGNKLGNADFGSPTSLYFRQRIQAPFFRCHLKGRCEGTQPEAVTFEPGANEWRTWDSWPPKSGIAHRKLHFHANGRLSFDTPASSAAQPFDSYVSDPARPVPYRPRPIPATYDPRGSGWSTW